MAAAVLAVVFAIAAGTKFRSPTITRQTIKGFGLPNPLLMAIVLPVTEAATALLLVVDPRTGGPCAVALLAAFTTLITGRLMAGYRDACGCFGAWSIQPLSWKHILRNLILIGLGVASTLG
ncbi:MAG: MauE/DoxX family redox-associated membrane protein [Acidimicrobiales bacterium]|nr:MauE/DoxX family redox-associated membrane protein [Acidimicrobiales bacterium]MDP7258468.1 MauE/DoxX family redox-associated membrane protein [Acidimicrobiales bacterium]HJO80574.1 MauE/DoxX family redox-associated membrane protein [Acidimicrobiales bacterium]